jgi:site-specific recombinase XerD
VSKRPVETLTENEVNRLLKSCSRRAPTGIRNAAMIAVMYRAGLRCGELIDLMPKDLDQTAGTIKILHGKGDKSRVVALDPGAWAIVQRWIDRRHERGFNGRQHFFCTLKGDPLQSAYIRNLMGRLGRKSGIEKRVHAHGLRHSFAAELAMENVPLPVIQHSLGHSSSATTARYIDHIAPTQVIDTLKARQWRTETNDE